MRPFPEFESATENAGPGSHADFVSAVSSTWSTATISFYAASAELNGPGTIYVDVFGVAYGKSTLAPLILFTHLRIRAILT